METYSSVIQRMAQELSDVSERNIDLPNSDIIRVILNGLEGILQNKIQTAMSNEIRQLEIIKGLHSNPNVIKFDGLENLKGVNRIIAALKQLSDFIYDTETISSEEIDNLIKAIQANKL